MRTHTGAHTVTPSTRVPPTQPTQIPLTRSVTSPFSLCAEFSPRSTNYSTRYKHRSKRLSRPQNEYLSKCDYIPTLVLTSRTPTSECLSASPRPLHNQSYPLGIPSISTFEPVFSVSTRTNAHNIHSEPLTFILSGVSGLVDKLFNST